MSQSANMTTNLALLQIVSVLALMVGAFMIWVGGSRAYEAYSSLSWPTVTGEITRSRVETRRDSGDNRSYRPQIAYEFVLEGAEYDGDYFKGERVRIDPEPSSSSQAVAAARAEEYPKGSAVEIYYDPNRPYRNLLEPSFSPTKLIYPAAGLLVFAIGLYLRRMTNSRK